METETVLQKIFEFCVKHAGTTLPWPNAEIKRFIRWAAYYRRLFIVWVDVKGGGKRIAAVGIAWRTEGLVPEPAELTVANTECGSTLFVHQVIVHPDFRHRGILFQLLSLALWRYDGIARVSWRSEHSPSRKTRSITVRRLIAALANQVELGKLRPYIRRRIWEAAVQHPQYPTLTPVQ